MIDKCSPLTASYEPAAPERMNSSCSLILDFKLNQHGSSFPILFTEGYFQKDPRISCWISLHFLGVSIAGKLQWMLVICIKMDVDGNGWTGNMEMIDPLDHLNEIVLQFILNNIEKHSNVYTSVKSNCFTQVVRNFSVGVQLWKENVSHSHEAFSSSLCSCDCLSHLVLQWKKRWEMLHNTENDSNGQITRSRDQINNKNTFTHSWWEHLHLHFLSWMSLCYDLLSS